VNGLEVLKFVDIVESDSNVVACNSHIDKPDNVEKFAGNVAGNATCESSPSTAGWA
jgi:hypothetical protein